MSSGGNGERGRRLGNQEARQAGVGGPPVDKEKVHKKFAGSPVGEVDFGCQVNEDKLRWLPFKG